MKGSSASGRTLGAVYGTEVDRLTYPQGQALTYAELQHGADVVDERLSDEKVGSALGSGPVPSGEGAAQLLTDAERREALFEPSPSG